MDKDLESVEGFLDAEQVLSRDPLDFDDANNNRIDDRLESKSGRHPKIKINATAPRRLYN